MNNKDIVQPKIINIISELKRVDKSEAAISIHVVGGNIPVAVAFFDIDKTLAHLDILYKEAIAKIFPNKNKEELIETFLAGFKLGNSFREFDRMHSIYIDGILKWKDPEIYIRERLNIHREDIDVSGNEIHDRAAEYLQQYGVAASEIASQIYENNREIFNSARIGPLYTLLEIYKRSGILMFGFTANARVFVEKLSMYLGLSDYFLAIATDETMEGGGKEIAIEKLLLLAENKGLEIPKEQLIFVGDSIRGDVGSGAMFCKNHNGYSGYGIVVLENDQTLIDIRHLVNTDKHIHSIISLLPTYGFVVSDVPCTEDGKPSLLARDMPKFLFKL